MAKDFFDDDLVGAGGRSVEERDGVSILPITDASIGRMVKQKQELSNQVAGAVGEIERLRKRQESLEREKQDLEDLSSKQEEYERGKREIVDKLGRGLVLVEKEQGQAVRMVELLGETRERFRESLSELQKIDEDSWSDDEFQTELNRALVRVDIAREMYRKALARIDSAGWHKSGNDKKPESDVFVEARRELDDKKGFGYWLVAGLAASLPLIVIILIVFALWLYFTGMWQV
jgi:signal recognition particle GTPase